MLILFIINFVFSFFLLVPLYYTGNYIERYVVFDNLNIIDMCTQPIKSTQDTCFWRICSEQKRRKTPHMRIAIFWSLWLLHYFFSSVYWSQCFSICIILRYRIEILKSLFIKIYTVSPMDQNYQWNTWGYSSWRWQRQ